jgi:hypothetical protein
MGATVTLSWLAVFGVFLSGFALGWVVAKLPVGGTIKVRLSPNLAPGTVPGNINITKSVVRRLTLKCQCGANWDFAEGSDALAPGTRPFPTGDTFECPSCGRSIDLKVERQLEAKALANLNFPKIS